MMDLTKFSVTAMVRSIMESWRLSRRRLAAQAELAALGSDSSRIAHDLNLADSELAHLAGLSPASADLLGDRLKSLRLDRDVIEKTNGTVMRDLQRVCSCCDLKSRCGSDLKSEKRSSAVSEYCPNEQTLQALR